MENRIKEVMKEIHVTQRQLAERLGITVIGTNQLVNTPMPKLETFQRIAEALNIPAWRLFLSDAEIKQVKGFNRFTRRDGKTTCPNCGKGLDITITSRFEGE